MARLPGTAYVLVLVAVIAGILSGVVDAQGAAIAPYFVDVTLEKVSEVDAVKQTFKARAAVVMHVPTLSPSTAYTGTEAIDGPYTRDQIQAHIPQYFRWEFANSADAKPLREDYFLTRGPSAEFLSNMSLAGQLAAKDVWIPLDRMWIILYSRYAGTFGTFMDLKDFPYDTQRLDVKVRMTLPESTTVFGFRPHSLFAVTAETPIDFTVVGSEVSSQTFTQVTLGLNFNMISFDILLKRDATYYNNKIIAGIVFIVVMSWSCFFLDVGDSNRLAIVSTLFLAIIAYLFLVASDVPKVSDSTRLDNFILWSMINVFMTYIHHSVIYFLWVIADRARTKWEKLRRKELTEEISHRRDVLPRPGADKRESSMRDRGIVSTNSGDSTEEACTVLPSGDIDIDFEVLATQEPQWFHVFFGIKRFILEFVVLVLAVLHYLVGSVVLLQSTASL